MCERQQLMTWTRQVRANNRADERA